MRAMPRTWPSIRLKRLAQDALMSLRMRAIYPYRVSVATPEERVMARASGSTQTGCCSATDHPAAAADDALMHDHSHHAGAARSPGKSPSAPDGTIYTCPMHPQIRQVGPGFCPICGMALEPLVATDTTASNPELADMTRRFWIGVGLSLPVVALGMLAELLGLNHAIDGATSAWVQFAFATPVVLWA